MGNHLVQLVLTQTTFWLCVVLFLRLFTFQRGDARFRRSISWMAWAVMGCSGSAVLFILKGMLLMPLYSWPLVVLLGVFTFAVFKARGNMAQVWRTQ
ncbi:MULTISPECIES: phage holin family protein [Pseudomonas]|uniref:Phage holin family protein n=1 Tax=Pseudomonas nitroreducens TaxID=46680 RepID=A0A6G6IPH9_PSENT|nr:MULTISPECIES: phage holin family protein [Pseudomonas]MDN6857261.1 phage holin family protein [Pseudomonas sp. CAN1]MDU4250492.1 phage holin family protein [Pseudomonas sp.]QIE84959.1 phage holin family protein [Pseudomonas nitroreducens]